MNRVVITGMGVVAPNGSNLEAFNHALQAGISGIRYQEELASLGFSCCIAGKPEPSPEQVTACFDALELKGMSNDGLIYGVLAGMEAWKDAGLEIPGPDAPDWDSGTIFGNGSSGVAKFREAVYKLDKGEVRKLGSTAVTQIMVSGVSAFLGGKLGLGNQVTTNSSACSTGTESLLLCYERIRSGQAKRMLSGSTSDSGPYIWGGFDAMKVCTYKHNDDPAAGSRPMSVTASGFVPGSGSGALVLESLEEAQRRGAHIYAEVLGGAVNSGGQRGSGSMTAPNGEAVQRCITAAIAAAGVTAADINAINGHLTATAKDGFEIQNWAAALQRRGTAFPYIHAVKSTTGHCLSASGSVECVAAVLQLSQGLLFPNINCEDLHPDIAAVADPACIPQELIRKELQVIAKASFGFGDVNACVLFKKYND